MSIFDTLKDFAAKLLGVSQRVDALDKTVQDLERKLEKATSALNLCIGELKAQKAGHKAEMDSLRRELESSCKLVNAQVKNEVQSSAYMIRDQLEQRFDRRVQCLEERLPHPHRLHAIETAPIQQTSSDDSAVVSRIAAGQ
jgi:DNA anti-recombination protein RmuC